MEGLRKDEPEEEKVINETKRRDEIKEKEGKKANKSIKKK